MSQEKVYLVVITGLWGHNLKDGVERNEGTSSVKFIHRFLFIKDHKVKLYDQERVFGVGFWVCNHLELYYIRFYIKRERERKNDEYKGIFFIEEDKIHQITCV